MAKKKAQTKKAGSLTGALSEFDQTVLSGITQAIPKLYTKHAEEIDRIRKESEVEKITVTFAVDIDSTESIPTITVGIRYSQSYTDRITASLPDPNQSEFTFVGAKEAKEAAKAAKAAKQHPEGGEDSDGEGEES